MGPHRFTVYDMLKRNGKHFKNAVALVSHQERMTFGEFLQKVQALSVGLFREGIHKGDRVAILAQNSPRYFLLLCAAAATGSIVIPINWRLSREEIQHILLDSAPKAIFFDEEFKELAASFETRCESLKKFFNLGDTQGDFVPFTELIVNDSFQEVDLNGNEPYLLLYTAAVQGKPRGAILSQSNVILCNVQAIGTMGLNSKDTYLAFLPLFHITGLALAFSVLHAGGRNIILPKFDPKAIAKMIDQERVTVIGSFPPILSQLMDEALSGRSDLTSLKHVVGIEARETIRRFQETLHGQFWLAYGQTETMGLTSLFVDPGKAGSAGKPGLLTEIRIVDEYDRELEREKDGEILVRGPLVFQGYWKQEELTKYTFREGWHHTGDIGRLDQEGSLWFSGRKVEKELIKPGGENVYPAEVEKAILEHPAVQKAVVFGVPDPKWGEAIKAVCQLKSGQILEAQELIDFVAQRIARYKKPHQVKFVDSLPLCSDGAPDRAKVKALYGQDHPKDPEAATPSNLGKT
jgi:long-chain acyl-CoA synthetase